MNTIVFNSKLIKMTDDELFDYIKGAKFEGKLVHPMLESAPNYSVAFGSKFPDGQFAIHVNSNLLMEKINKTLR